MHIVTLTQIHADARTRELREQSHRWRRATVRTPRLRNR
jgi:hypothetical protein